ncbi:metallophosphoesterase [Agriterribacter humi]|uniref:metallophosphoesterase n=1 Tax=Agriterribacter humi TaxID=1104781 RepID=UPI00126579D6|nr:metallophosphoesterase [Agriterribacter humi]
MTLQYCSDLHLEFRENKQFLNQHPLQSKGEILILAGDIVPFIEMDKHKEFFNYISDNFKLTYWLPGNHEYYYSDASERSGTINEKIRDNIFLVNNISFQHNDVRLIFSTLWSKISPVNEWQIERSINDFQVIKFNGHFFSVSNFNQLHSDSLNFIDKELSQNNAGKTVVVSHHVPTFLNFPSQYKGSILNEAFVVELFPLIESSNINYWIYGHHHSNTPEFSIGNTVLLTNQMGYIRNEENQDFRLDKIVTL